MECIFCINKTWSNQAAVSKMSNGENMFVLQERLKRNWKIWTIKKYIINRTGCEAKYAKDFVYTENMNINDKSSEIPIGASCRTCDRLDCYKELFLHYIKNLM